MDISLEILTTDNADKLSEQIDQLDQSVLTTDMLQTIFGHAITYNSIKILTMLFDVYNLKFEHNEYMITRICRSYVCCGTPSLSMIQLLVNNGLDLDYKTSDGLIIKDQLFEQACQNNVMDTIKYLIDYGVDINANYGFIIACENQNCQLLEYLLSLGLNNETLDRCLYFAFKHKYLKMVEMLIKAGANGGNMMLYEQIDPTNDEIARWHKIIDTLVSQGADPIDLLKINYN